MGENTMPGPEHPREPIDWRTTPTPQDIDGRSTRPGLGATLSQAADLLLEVARAQRERLGDELPTDGEDAEAWALESIKTLMLAGWSAPSERTIGIPNGLVLHEEQWQGLINGQDAWIITPGGEWALQLTVHTSQAPPSANVREQLWELRENAHDPTRGSSTWDKHGSRDVTVPRSFLSFIVMLATEFRRADDYAAANSLDNALATISDQLQAARIPWTDGSENTPPRAPSAPPVRADENTAQLHRDIITVLRYVSGGLDYARPSTYPDVQARRALGKIDLRETSRGEDDDDASGRSVPWWSPLRASAGTAPKPGGVKPVRDMTIREVQQLITDFEEKHAVTPSKRTDQSTIDDLRHSLKLAQDELEKVKREGVPGVMHEVDQAFHRLALTERDHAWVESANRKRRIDEFAVEVAKLTRRLASDTEDEV